MYVFVVCIYSSKSNMCDFECFPARKAAEERDLGQLRVHSKYDDDDADVEMQPLITKKSSSSIEEAKQSIDRADVLTGRTNRYSTSTHTSRLSDEV